MQLQAQLACHVEERHEHANAGRIDDLDSAYVDDQVLVALAGFDADDLADLRIDGLDGEVVEIRLGKADASHSLNVQVRDLNLERTVASQG